MHLPTVETNTRSECLGAPFENYSFWQMTCRTTSSTTIGQKGAWVSLGTTTFTYEHINLFGVGASAQANIAYFGTVDLGAGSDGSQYVIAGDLIFTAKTLGDKAEHWSLKLPLHIPQGTNLWVRTAAAVVTTGPQYDIALIGYSSWLGGMPGYSQCFPIHNPATRVGGQLILGPLTINTFGSYVAYPATTRHTSALMAVCDRGNAGGTVARRSIVEVVDPTTAILMTVIEARHPTVTGLLYHGGDQHGPIPCNLASGSVLSARHQSNNNTPGQRDIGVGLYGFA